MKVYIFIDESGTLPDPDNKFIVLSAIASDDLTIFSTLIHKTKKLSRIRKGIEIKFYSAGDRTREFYLRNLPKEKVSIFSLTVYKGKQQIGDSPENYSVLSWLLLLDCLAYLSKDTLEIIFDRHFHRNIDEARFFKVLGHLIGSKVKVRSADSREEPGVTAADMVAGACLYAKSGKSDKYFGLIKEKLISDKLINWKEAKKKFIEASKNSPEPM